MIPADWLPVIFVGLMGLAVLIYAILDGYDLGVGIMLPLDNEAQADTMVASIGPFWDANETWLVLAVGLLLIAFPQAHSLVLRELYIPAAIMLIGLIMRGVAFDFRAKAAVAHKPIWDKTFKLGSLVTALAQGYMLGMYVMGFQHSLTAYLFSGLAAFGVAAAYCFIGATWLVMKTSDELQLTAARWARRAGWICFTGVLAVCAMNPLVNPEILARWLSFPYALFVWAIPVVCFALFAIVDQVLKRFPLANDTGCWLPFVGAMLIFTFCFSGLGYSFFPYIVPGQLTIWESASAPESLRFILWGAMVVVPVILLYTFFSYRVFWGKVQDLKYY